MHTLPPARIAQLARRVADMGRASGDPTAMLMLAASIELRAALKNWWRLESVDVKICNASVFFERIVAGMDALVAGRGNTR